MCVCPEDKRRDHRIRERYVDNARTPKQGTGRMKLPALTLTAALLASAAQAGPLSFTVSVDPPLGQGLSVIDFDNPPPAGDTLTFSDPVNGGIATGTVVASHVQPAQSTGNYATTSAGYAAITF